VLTGMVRFPARSGSEVDESGDAGLPGGDEGDDELHWSTASPTVVMVAWIAWQWRAEARPELADAMAIA
jgi:hypothetical protein